MSGRSGADSRHIQKRHRPFAARARTSRSLTISKHKKHRRCDNYADNAVRPLCELPVCLFPLMRETELILIVAVTERAIILANEERPLTA